MNAAVYDPTSSPAATASEPVQTCELHAPGGCDASQYTPTVVILNGHIPSLTNVDDRSLALEENLLHTRIGLALHIGYQTGQQIQGNKPRLTRTTDPRSDPSPA